MCIKIFTILSVKTEHIVIYMVCKALSEEDLGKGPWRCTRHPPLYPTIDRKGSAVSVPETGHQSPPSQETNLLTLLLKQWHKLVHACLLMYCESFCIIQCTDGESVLLYHSCRVQYAASSAVRCPQLPQWTHQLYLFQTYFYESLTPSG